MIKLFDKSVSIKTAARAYFRMGIICFGIVFGGLFLCGFIAWLVTMIFGFDSLTTNITLTILIAPLLVSFLLGLGLGNHALVLTLEKEAEERDK